MERMLTRIQSIFLAGKYRVPSVDIQWIKWGALKGLALRRFDLSCGRRLWREESNQVNLPLRNKMDFLDKKDRLDFLKRFILVKKLGFEHEFTFLMPKPQAYPANGPDEFDLFSKVERKIRLAPFIGQMRKAKISGINEKELIETGYACGFTARKILELEQSICSINDMDSAMEDAHKLIEQSEEFHV